MPYVNVTTIRGLLSPGQKQILINKLSDVLVEVEGAGNPDFRKMVWISIEERAPESFGLGELRPSSASIAQFVAVRDAAVNTR
ncbi:tautomerase family protein [Undibacterium sp. Jales W-56]|uniref:tautomerase family protein n=1 Tax=Undibacterium sp. Jales W-56 TaxID=2897325 RepID=UPI0021CE59BE|nr:tautomerase family protein [Undibacterium sp. Jales W-56]MCU6434312.1 tautomerase family protein [Undibacterium sp. Jales W-56]